jgi:hypothetical protein
MNGQGSATIEVMLSSIDRRILPWIGLIVAFNVLAGACSEDSSISGPAQVASTTDVVSTTDGLADDAMAAADVPLADAGPASDVPSEDGGSVADGKGEGGVSAPDVLIDDMVAPDTLLPGQSDAGSPPDVLIDDTLAPDTLLPGQADTGSLPDVLLDVALAPDTLSPGQADVVTKPCDPATATTEVCNQQDDDCDGQTDEDPDALCADISPCVKSECGKMGACISSPKAGSCDDGNPCTKTAACEKGACKPGPMTNCDDGNSCTVDLCHGGTGKCLHIAEIQDGKVCNDGSICTPSEQCKAGKCVGKNKPCDDGKVCTDDGCDPKKGCTYKANAKSCACASVPANPKAKYQPGKSYFGTKNYIQYIAGDLPIVISSPHGGTLKPSEIPDRTWGTTVYDSYSMHYTLETISYLVKKTGRQPHVIINRLSRIKLDANRPIGEAAQGHPIAEKAYKEFHAFINAAKASVTAGCGKGLYLDHHTNGHSDAWVEMGYRLSKTDLKQTDKLLDTSKYITKSSLKNLASQPGQSLASLVRGKDSVGNQIQTTGYKCVPSIKYPDPGAGGYFNGGYNTETHGSKHGGTIDGMQVEAYSKFLGSATRTDFSNKLGAAILHFVQTHYGFKLGDPGWKPPPHGVCSGAKTLKLVKGKVTVNDTTTGSSHEFGPTVKCGNSFTLAGPQLYYAVAMTKDKSYKLTLHSDFAMRAYLFAAPCVGSALNASCTKSGFSGPLLGTNQTQSYTVKASKTGVHTIAVDSRNAAWHGPFQLTIEAL